MPKINITRGAGAKKMRREEVPNGAVFAVANREGRLGVNYAAIGMNGRMYSVNLKTGELASSSNDDKNVTLTGKWSFGLKLSPRVTRVCVRSEVRPGELFKVHGKEKVYAHMGRITRDHTGWLSIPISNTDNHAFTTNGKSHVDVVGTFELNAELAS